MKRPDTTAAISRETSSYRWHVHYAGPIGAELSRQDYDSILPVDKPYVPDKEDALSDNILQDTSSKDFSAKEKDVEDMDDDELNELVNQLLSKEEEAKEPNSELVSILKVPSKDGNKDTSAEEKNVEDMDVFELNELVNQLLSKEEEAKEPNSELVSTLKVPSKDGNKDTSAEEKDVEDMDVFELDELVHQILSIEEEAKEPNSGLVSTLKVPSKDGNKDTSAGEKDNELNEVVHQLLAIEEFITEAKKPNSELVSILKVPSKGGNKRPSHRRRVRFALN